MYFKKDTLGRTDRLFQMLPKSYEEGSGIQMEPFNRKGKNKWMQGKMNGWNEEGT